MICMSVDEFIKEHNIDIKNADLKSLNTFASICDTTIMGGHNTFVKKSNLELELFDLSRQLKNYGIILYKHLDKPHPLYSYYYVLGFSNEDIMSVKKLFKASKLKAFL